MCINRDKNGKHQIAETNLSNNCLTKPLVETLPDLSVRVTGFRLYKPDDFSFWDLIPPFEFKPSICAKDCMFVEVTNHGKASSMPVRVQGAIGAGRGTNGVLYKDVPAILPGQSKTVGFYFPKTKPSRYKLGRCAKWTLSATVDSDKKLYESREDNNRHQTSAQGIARFGGGARGLCVHRDEDAATFAFRVCDPRQRLLDQRPAGCLGRGQVSGELQDRLHVNTREWSVLRSTAVGTGSTAPTGGLPITRHYAQRDPSW